MIKEELMEFGDLWYMMGKKSKRKYIFVDLLVWRGIEEKVCSEG